MVVAQTAEVLEGWARGFGVQVEGGNGHEATWLKVGEWL